MFKWVGSKPPAQYETRSDNENFILQTFGILFRICSGMSQREINARGVVSARPRRDNTLWQRSRKRAPPNLQRLMFFIMHRIIRGLRPTWESNAVVTFKWELIVSDTTWLA